MSSQYHFFGHYMAYTPNLKDTSCLSYKAYNSKYKEAANSENPQTVDFRDRLNEFIENFDELVKAL